MGKRIGELIRKVRVSQGIKANALARKARVLPSNLSRIENGQIQSPAREVITRICQVLGITDTQLAEVDWTSPSDSSSASKGDQNRRDDESDPRDVLPIVRHIVEQGLAGPLTLHQFQAMFRAWYGMTDAGLDPTQVWGKRK